MQITAQKYFYDKISKQFSIPCFHPACNIKISDKNVIRLAGKRAYNKYKEVATRLFVELETSGVICPLAGCGDAMLGVPSIEEMKIVE